MKWLILTLAFLYPYPTRDSLPTLGLVIWNVGQGQMVTWNTPTTCLHFDLGGEYFPAQVASLCRHKNNEAYFSHWDWDHIGFTWLTSHAVGRLCIVRRPLGKSRRQVWLARIPDCSTAHEALGYWAPTQARSSNAWSQVWTIDGWALVPGDSPRSQEKHWSAQLEGLRGVHVLVLGHHGSMTSTSKFLLDRLPRLRMAIASSRWARYHHPHSKVVAELRSRGIALLKTEDWGTIFIER